LKIVVGTLLRERLGEENVVRTRLSGEKRKAGKNLPANLKPELARSMNFLEKDRKDNDEKKKKNTKANLKRDP